MWEEICTEVHLVTNSNVWREFKWKAVMRTPNITAKFSTTHSNKCWRNCGPHIGNQTHILWICPKLEAFWKEVF